MRDFSLTGDVYNGVAVQATVCNTGLRRGVHVVELFTSYEGDAPEQSVEFRFAGCAKVDLEAGETCAVTIDLEPRRFSSWISDRWEVPRGHYVIHQGPSAGEAVEIGRITV